MLRFILLEVIWNNLISNVIKFTDEGGKLEISLNKVDNYAIVSVKDNGCGISEEVGKTYL